MSDPHPNITTSSSGIITMIAVGGHVYWMVRDEAGWPTGFLVCDHCGAIYQGGTLSFSDACRG